MKGHRRAHLQLGADHTDTDCKNESSDSTVDLGQRTEARTCTSKSSLGTSQLGADHTDTLRAK